MAHEMFNNFNKKRREAYEENTGVRLPPIEDLVTNHSVFEKQEIPEIEELTPGLRLEKGNLPLDNGSFVNFYDVSLVPESGAVEVDLFSRDTPIHLKRIIQNDPLVIAVTNGGFFFLADNAPDQEIQNSNLQLEIRNGRINSLPVADRPLLYLKDKQLHVQEIIARGTVMIGGGTYSWRGSASSETGGNAVLYTAASGVIVHEKSEQTGLVRIVKPVYTPKGRSLADIIVARSRDGDLFVKSVQQGGGSSVYQGIGVLQVDSKAVVNPGEKIHFTDVDSLRISKISSGFCIGPNVADFLHNQDHQINHDASLGDNEAFSEKRIARNVVYEDANGRVHIRLFDGVPNSKVCSGISPKEVAVLFASMGARWAYHLDGGQSARIVTREVGQEQHVQKFKSFGNTHYMRWPKKSNHPYLWDPSVGRKVSSGLIFRIANNK